MTSFLTFLFGYRIFSFENCGEEVLNILLSGGMPVLMKEGKICVRVGKIRKMQNLLGTRVKFKMSDMRGIGGFIYNHRHSWGAVIALVLSTLLFIFSSMLVWDVRIEGEDVDDSAVLGELSACGLYPGRLWASIDRSRIELQMLERSDEVSWLNINRRGGVAYVKVMKKEVHDVTEPDVGYASIVAVTDAVIEEISVVSGVALVKVGDSVKAGDVLISGIIESETGVEFCRASGRVIGRVSDSIRVEIPRMTDEKVYHSEKTEEIRLNIFNFSAKIFKLYGNSHESCDIIEETKELMLPSNKKMPVSLTVERILSYTVRERRMSDGEMTSAASDATAAMLGERLRAAELLRISTSGEFKEGMYVMDTGFVCAEQIGEPLPLSLTEKISPIGENNG